METPKHLPNSPTPGARTASLARFWNLHCWTHQKIIAHCADTLRPLPGRTHRHVNHCPACRQFYATQSDLTQRLVTEPKPQSHSPSPFLHARIMASVDQDALARNQRPRLIPVPIWGTALVLVGIGVLAIPFFRHPPSATSSGNEHPSTAMPSIRQLAGALPENLNRDLIKLSKTVDQPLETEMKSVVTDAKAAIHLLAGNFLPGE